MCKALGLVSLKLAGVAEAFDAWRCAVHVAMAPVWVLLVLAGGAVAWVHGVSPVALVGPVSGPASARAYGPQSA